MKPVNTVMENTGDFTSQLTDNALVHKKYVDNRNGYTHTQSVASSLWTVNHNLGYKPAGIMVEDSAFADWEGDVTHIDVNTLTISFNGLSFAGKAYIS